MSSTTATMRYGSMDITPAHAIPLAGFAARRNNYNDIHDPLEANLIVLHDGNITLAFLSIDTLFIGKDISRACARYARDYLGIDDKYLLVVASHTHFAPSLDPSKPLLGITDDAYLKETLHKLDDLFRQTSQTAAIPVVMEKIEVPLRHAVHRRRKGWHIDPSRLRIVNGTYMAPDFDAPQTDMATLIRLKTPEGKTTACLWNYACHPTAFTPQGNVSADYPGFVRHAIREGLGANIPVVFLQGFAGDKRPIELGGDISLKGKILRIVGGPHFGKFNPDTYASWANSLAKNIACSLEEEEGQPLTPSFFSKETSIPISDLIEHTNLDEESLSIRLIQLTPSLRILAISAEVVESYREKIIRKTNDKSLVTVGYMSSCFGYLPTDVMIEEGGYESEGFFAPFGLTGKFLGSIENKVLSAVLSLYDEAKTSC